MNKILTHATRSFTLLLAFGCLSSCMDDNYDLSDIDTTTELKVNNLTIPVTLKDVYLDKIIDLDDSDPDALIKVRELNGQRYYFLSKTGDFNANPKNIDPIHAPKPSYKESTSINVQALSGGTIEYVDYNITEHNNDFTYRVGQDGNPKVDDAIQYITDVTLSDRGLLTVGMTFGVGQANSSIKSMEIFDLVLNIPQGTTVKYAGQTYTGRTLTIPHLKSVNGKLALELQIVKMSFATTASPEGKKVVDGKFDFSEAIGIKSGKLRLYSTGGQATSVLPTNLNFITHYTLTPFTVSNFSGVFDYIVDFNEINSIDLSDMPDFLAGEQTDITLTAPALTLTLNSPVAKYGLSCATGLTLTSERDGRPANTANAPKIEISDKAEKQFIILSQQASQSQVMEYIDVPAGMTAAFSPFNNLNSLLAGQGLPRLISVDFTSSLYPSPHVFGTTHDFPLGVPFDQIHGHYEFVTPLSLAHGSRIVYSTTEDGWNDEDLDAVAVSSLKVTAKLTSTIPANMKVHVVPVDKNGKRIALTDPAAASITLPSMAANQEVTFLMQGDIRHLDGIYIEAVADDFNGTTLSPDQTLKVSDLRATVSGTYVKEL